MSGPMCRTAQSDKTPPNVICTEPKVRVPSPSAVCVVVRFLRKRDYRQQLIWHAMVAPLAIVAGIPAGSSPAYDSNTYPLRACAAATSTMRVSIASLAAAALGLATRAAAIDPIVIKGSKFFNEKTGDQFFFKGVAYQPRTGVKDANPDPLADSVGCKRDVAVFKDLGINSIRVYEVDYNKNHDDCMQMLEDAGIYVMLDIPSPDYAINREDPEWNTQLMGNWQAKIDAFSKYPNVIAWIAGNEVANDKDTTPSAAFVKAAIRDMRAYLKSKDLSTPVGYADNDDMDIRMNLINYFDCDDEDSRAQFYAINTYRWCGDDATFKSSGYSDITKNMTDYSIPSLLTEYGCNKVRPRTFHEVASIFGSDMDGTLSGGLMYEYTEEDNDYGIVSVSYGSTKVSQTEDYSYFKKAMASADPSGVKMSSYKPSSKDSVCPSVGDNWEAKPGSLPPTPSNSTCECMMKSLSCVSKLKSVPTSSSDLKTFGQNVGSIFGTVCKDVDCGDVSTDAEEGQYGKYSFCDAIQRVSWVMNAWYIEQRGVDGSCDFDGFAETVKPSLSSDSTCSDQESTNKGSGSNSSDDGEESSGSGSKSSGASAIGMGSMSVGAIFALAAASLF
ncbi:40S ribosomal protein S27 [Coemansia sp. RSA 1722]|nr:40S ribosomal protein S27 [Coemansia sp. RSA 1722]